MTESTACLSDRREISLRLTGRGRALVKADDAQRLVPLRAALGAVGVGKGTGLRRG